MLFFGVDRLWQRHKDSFVLYLQLALMTQHVAEELSHNRIHWMPKRRVDTDVNISRHGVTRRAYLVEGAVHVGAAGRDGKLHLFGAGQSVVEAGVADSGDPTAP